MDRTIKRQARGRIVTLMAKINELKMIGYKDNELNSTLPFLEEWEQVLISAYEELRGI